MMGVEVARMDVVEWSWGDVGDFLSANDDLDIFSRI